jgi:hypothetical protein
MSPINYIIAEMVSAVLTEDEMKWVTPTFWDRSYRHPGPGPVPYRQVQWMASHGWIAQSAYYFARDGYRAAMDSRTGALLIFKSPVAE